MELLNLIKEEQKRWVVGVSGGADSMALLDICRSRGIFIVAAHVNYRRRDTADRDMMGVKTYCDRYSIPFACKIIEDYEEGQNFQAYARELRYAFFQATAKQYDCVGVMVAHQLDDHIETCLLQKQRGAHIRYAGIQPSVILYGQRVERPLLGYTKQELENYCARHHVTYYHDESNFTDHYARNQIRHRIIDQMSYEEKQKMVKEIAEFNENLLNREAKLKELVSAFQRVPTAEALKPLDEGTALSVIRRYLEQYEIYHISEPQLRKIYGMLLKTNGNEQCRVHHYLLRNEYGKISLQKAEAIEYAYQIVDQSPLTTPYFRIAETGETIDACTVYKEDYPLTIRSPKRGDAIILRFGRKRLSRWFIDRKIPVTQREIWPVVVNKDGKIIFVVGIGCDIEHFSNNPNLFVLK